MVEQKQFQSEATSEMIFTSSIVKDPYSSEYTSQRSVVIGCNGMVGSSQYLASQAGLQILQNQNGNAIDAAVAAAACLTVVEPTCNGIGSDLFAIIKYNNKLYGLNASGYSAQSISINKVMSPPFNCKKMPSVGVVPCNIPGAPAGWAALTEKFGKLSLEQNLKSAINYARNGYAVTPIVQQLWQKGFNKYNKKAQKDKYKNKNLFDEWFNTFTIKDTQSGEIRVPKVGEIWKSENHAQTLEKIAKSYAKEFYQGEIAKKIEEFFKQHEGFITEDDLKKYQVDWVEPISTQYKDFDIWEIPPNGQGLVVLLALNILKNFNLGNDKKNAESVHKIIESIKLSFADGKKWITQKECMPIDFKLLLDQSYAQERAKLINNDNSQEFQFGNPQDAYKQSKSTVYLSTADKDGNMVSMIQSNYAGFGSGIVIPGTGIAMNNRGNSFSLSEKDVNCLQPHKKPYHTIIPGFITKQNNINIGGPFGVMGGFFQPQGQVQLLTNIFDFHLNPQEALDAPRFFWSQGDILVEKNFNTKVKEELEKKGHKVKVQETNFNFGRGQIIFRNQNGVLFGGTDPRADGSIVTY